MTGRNEPCPCGSGKKYKKCCLRNAGSSAPGNPADVLKQVLGEQQFPSIEQARRFVDAESREINSTPIDDFQGLTPEQMHQLMNKPFDSPGLVTIADHLDLDPTIPVLALFYALADEIRNRGVKTNAKGQLTQKTLLRVRRTVLGNLYEIDDPNDFQTERDYPDLTNTRINAEASGLMKTEARHLVLTDLGRMLTDARDHFGIYIRLLENHITRLDWSLFDPMPTFPIIQRSALYTLFLLARYGTGPREAIDYVYWFTDAFPNVADELENHLGYSALIEILEPTYSVRALRNFAGLFGLLDYVPVRGVPASYRVKKSRLLDRLFTFHLDLPPVPESIITCSLRISTNDRVATETFYACDLGLEVEDGDYGEIVVGFGDFDLVIEVVDEDSEVIGRDTGLYFDVSDIASTCEALRERGVVFVSPPEEQADGTIRARFRDPSGNILGLLEEPEEPEEA